MPAQLLSPPAAPAISLAEAKLNLRIDGDELDPLVMAWAQGVTDHAEHLMGRAIQHQTWRLTLDTLADAIALPRPPLVAVLAVRLRDDDGSWRVLAPERYTVDTGSEPAKLYWVRHPALPAITSLPTRFPTRWPSVARDDANGYSDGRGLLQIDCLCGYGAEASATPSAIRLYLLAKLAEQFDASTRPERNSVTPSFIDRLLDRYCIPEVA